MRGKQTFSALPELISDNGEKERRRFELTQEGKSVRGGNAGQELWDVKEGGRGGGCLKRRELHRRNVQGGKAPPPRDLTTKREERNGKRSSVREGTNSSRQVTHQAVKKNHPKK